ncbi:hypothetical protein [Pseudomonas guariconensis]|uniref:hypothetical protein n=1 Tax=Pseudomonas guariconensis TaxID=1288410 RepID=UPI0018A91D10|nr:hypothetical protein [Pseudomonas guariconensis]MBF8743484.1 hypothetical protein [Pseudomonas guariconensis]MBF8749232.1 hypothetical protein [Pseudomonas guariconensis]
MRFVQERSFIATFVSMTPGYPGTLDSIEGSPAARRNAWLTVDSRTTGLEPQQFWFGYFEGGDAGYQVRTVMSGPDGSHHDFWDLSFNKSVGYYIDSKNPILWRVRVDGAKLKMPEQRIYEGVTLAAPGQAMLSVANRAPWDEHFVGVGKPNTLYFRMDVREVNVPEFVRFDQYRRR